MIDYAAINVILLDERVSRDRFESGACSQTAEPAELLSDIRCLLTVFNGVHVIGTGSSCLEKTRLLDSVATDCNPVFVLLPVTGDLQSATKPGSARSSYTLGVKSVPSNYTSKELSHLSGDEDIHGIALLKHYVLEISERHFSRLVVPIAVVDSYELQLDGSSSSTPSAMLNPAHAAKCIEMGAADVISSPLSADRLRMMSSLAYRAHIEGTKARSQFLEVKKSRKLSWVGVDEERPYAYLREVMVSTLMGNICKPEAATSKPAQGPLYKIFPKREQFVIDAIGKWGFPAHDLADDELVHAGYLMLQHALSMPELERWRLPSDDLKNFVLACRSAYNSFVLFHNFRHVIDVLQAMFFSLVRIGTLPPFPPNSSYRAPPPSPMAALLRPFEAFVLLVTAIGHDVGHPGVSNAFLVALKAPLAQLYNDNSVLEAFHCAAYSQVLRRYWPSAYNDTEVRSLLIKSILATDMQLHFKYMVDLGNLQEKLAHNKGTDGWSVKDLEDYKILACGLLIKCADISNPARPFDISARWADVLQLEWARQGEMEQRIGLETTLFGGPPELGNLTKLANSQVGFMNTFAYPLFEAVADILPPMRFGINEIKANVTVWKDKIASEKSKEHGRVEAEQYSREGFQSPRSGSPDRLFAGADSSGSSSSAAVAGASHPEGLPATGLQPRQPPGVPMSSSQGVLDPVGLGRSGEESNSDSVSRRKPFL